MAGTVDEAGIRADERRRIARDLHDDLGQRMAAIRLSVGELMEADDRSLVDVAERIDVALAEAIECVRTLTFELRNHPDERNGEDSMELDIATELRTLTAWSTTLSGIACTVSVSAPPPRIAGARGRSVCLAVRELLVNVMRHSRATSAIVTIEGSPDRIRIVVEDDGVGIPVAPLEPTSGSGLGIVAERISDIGGVMWSDPLHRGHRVVLVVPTEGRPVAHEACG